jgi:hypothetical protein
MALGSTQPLREMSKGKGKAIQLQVLTGPEDSRGSRILIQSAHEGGKVVSPTYRPSLPPGNIQQKLVPGIIPGR